jgi:hypothetical protein
MQELAPEEAVRLFLAAARKGEAWALQRPGSFSYTPHPNVETIIASMTRQCSVFMSSTSEDLREYRVAVRDAVLAVGLRPEMMEYFAASGGPPLSECLARVAPCELLVVLLAHRTR